MKSMYRESRECVVPVSPDYLNLLYSGYSKCISSMKTLEALLLNCSQSSLVSIIKMGRILVAISSWVRGPKSRFTSSIMLFICWAYDVVGPVLVPFFWLTQYADITRVPSYFPPRSSVRVNLTHGSLRVCAMRMAIIAPPGWYMTSSCSDMLDVHTTLTTHEDLS